MSMHTGNRRGFSLMELLIAITLLTIVFSLAVPFFSTTSRSVASSAGRGEALQGARYAQNAIDRDLRVAGTGAVGTQPLVVQADRYALTFNADIVTRDSTDLAAITTIRTPTRRRPAASAMDTRSRCPAARCSIPTATTPTAVCRAAPRRSRSGSPSTAPADARMTTSSGVGRTMRHRRCSRRGSSFPPGSPSSATMRRTAPGRWWRLRPLRCR